jgi:hypothetical protein
MVAGGNHPAYAANKGGCLRIAERRVSKEVDNGHAGCLLVQHRFHLPRIWALQPKIREEGDHLIQLSRDSFA